MAAPPSYFAHESKIKSHGQMMETLKARTAGASSAQAKLPWNPPVIQQNGSGYQTAGGTDYVVRKTLTNEKWMYWAWYGKKLLGYSPDIEIAKTHCEAHAMGGTR